MKDFKSFELDLDMLLDSWNCGLIGEDLDHVSNHNLSSLKRRLMKLVKEYTLSTDPDMEEMLQNDSAGG